MKIKKDYELAVQHNLTQKDRYHNGIAHHPKSIQLMKFLCEHDFKDYNDYFGFSIGHKGDNGETLMYQMDAFFELQDKLKKSD